MIKRILAVAFLATAVGVPPVAAQFGKLTHAGLSDQMKDLLANSRYVYISSKRDDTTFGKPAEIWFMFHDDAVWVGTSPQSWRAKRIKEGRPMARITVGTEDGPLFFARGKIVKDPKVEDLLCETFARKYPEGWPKHEENFRKGFKNGSRILIRYAPIMGGRGAYPAKTPKPADGEHSDH